MDTTLLIFLLADAAVTMRTLPGLRTLDDPGSRKAAEKKALALHASRA